MARVLGVNPQFLDCLSVGENYPVGFAGQRFGQTADYLGDMAALEEADRAVAGPLTASAHAWGGVFICGDEDIMDESGDYCVLDGEHYVNTLVTKGGAAAIVANNPHLHTSLEGKKTRVYGGMYAGAEQGLLPPLHLSRLDLTGIVMPPMDTYHQRERQHAAAEKTVTSGVSTPGQPAPGLPKLLRSILSNKVAGMYLADALRGPGLVLLQASTDKKSRNRPLLQFKEGAAGVEAGASITEVYELITRISSHPGILAFLLKQIDQLFIVDFVELTVTPRAPRVLECGDDDELE
jgi:hypothetical protein